MQTIKVKEEKVAARIELENGDVHQIMSPNFEQLKEFDSIKQSDDEDSLFKAFEKLGLPMEVGKKLPITVLHKISDTIMGGEHTKK